MRARVSRRCAFVFCCALATGASQVHATTANWLSAVTGGWSNASNWSSAPNYPNNGSPVGTTYDVVIGATGSSYTVSFSGIASDSIDSLTLNSSNATLKLLGGALNVANGVTVNAGTFQLTGGTFAGSISGGGTVTIGGFGGSLLNGVTLNDDASIANPQQWIQGGLAIGDGHTLTFTGSAELDSKTNQSITGNASLHFSAGSNLLLPQANTTLTIGSGITATTMGTNGGVTFGDNSGGTNTNAVVNNGTIWQASTSGYTNLVGGFTNNGVIRVDAGMLNLGGVDSLSSWGTVIRNGGFVNFMGSLNNTGKTLDLANTPLGKIDIATGASITGGTITNSGSAVARFVRPPSGGIVDVFLSDVTLASSMNVENAELDVHNSLTLSGNPTLHLVGSDLTPIGVVVAGNGSITGNGVISYETSGSAAAIVESLGGTLTIGPGVTIRGTSSFGTVSAFSGIINQGTISAQASGKNLVVDNGINNQGTVEARNGGRLYIYYFQSATLSNNTLNNGNWGVYANSTLDFNGNTFTTNNANILLDGVNSSFAAVAPLATNNGTFAIDHQRNFTTLGALTNTGTLRVDTGCTLTVNGTLTNSGKIQGNGTIHSNVTSSGTIAPGDSPGKLSIDGNVTQNSSGLLDIQIDGTTPGVDFDLLVVTGDATLAGTLQIELLDGYIPPSGQTFDFLNAASEHVNFSQVILPNVPGVTWDTSALSRGQITALPEPTGGLAGAGIAMLLFRRRRAAR